MYSFRDTTITPEGGLSLPSEALQINGKFIEVEIPGYKTVSVSGREALSPELESFTTGIHDGATLKSKKYPARTIRVKYQLTADTPEEFRKSFNRLAQILDVQDAELVFNDEQDKYFIGTPSMFEDVDPGRNTVIGEFELFCADPFKYSIVEYEANPLEGEDSLLVDYAGTYKSFPVLRAEFYKQNDTSENGEFENTLTSDGECGYVAFFNDNAKIIQLGDPDEEDGTAYAKSQTLVNSSFENSTGWGAAAKKLWKVNSGITTNSSVIAQVGTMGVKATDFAKVITETSGTLLNTASKSGNPVVHYAVSAKTYGRTSNSVKVTIAIKSWLDKDSNSLGTGVGLKGQILIGGSWKDVTIKNTSASWKGKSGHTVNITVTVSGLTSTSKYISGIKFKVVRTDSGGSAGVIGETVCNSLIIAQYTSINPRTYYLTPLNYGSGSHWHGTSITRVIPADASGVAGAVNCQLTYAHKMSIGEGKNSSKQLGAMQVLLVTGTGPARKIVAGVNVFKSSSGKKGKLRFYVNAHTVETLEVDLSYGNRAFGPEKTSYIQKNGDTIVFNIGGLKKTYKDAAIKDTAINEVTFTITKNGTKPQLDYNGLYFAKFVKNNCETWREVPNKFSANDVVEADCKSGSVRLNGDLDPSLGALGNDWEDFCLYPGLNVIGFSWSDWVKAGYEPKFKVRYREVYL